MASETTTETTVTTNEDNFDDFNDFEDNVTEDNENENEDTDAETTEGAGDSEDKNEEDSENVDEDTSTESGDGDDETPIWAKADEAPETVQLLINDEVVDVPVQELVNRFGLRPEKVKMVVNKEEKELSWDEIQREVNRSKSSAQAFTEAQKMRQQVELAFSNIRNDPVQGLREMTKHLGIDIEDVATQILEQDLELKLMNPTERELRQLKSQLSQQEAIRKQQEQNQLQERLSLEREEFNKQITNDVNQSLKSVGLPNTEFTFQRTLNYLAMVQQNAAQQVMEKSAEAGTRIDLKTANQLLHDNGFRPDPNDIISMVKEDYLNEFKQLTQVTPEEDLIKVLGKNATKIGKVKKVQNKGHKIGNANKEKKSDKMTQEETEQFWEELGL